MIAIAIPMLDEAENVNSLLQELCDQSYQDFALYVCVNQPEGWWDDGEEEHKRVCQSNAATIEVLRHAVTPFTINIIDHTSRGAGWQGKKRGVGWARKEIMNSIATRCEDEDIVVSMDADTHIGKHYLRNVAETMRRRPNVGAIGVPYYHPLTREEGNDRSLLRYESYMRQYLIEMMRIGSPYAFTAIGSAMVFRLKTYKRVGGYTPLQGGEDFYLMQKFAKTGVIINHLDSESEPTSMRVEPSGRASKRVPFGTGPAVGMSIDEQERHYPFYRSESFDKIKETYDTFQELYERDIETPMSQFLREQLRTEDVWGPLRKNFKTKELFIHACHERVDGLRILQYLKSRESDRYTKDPIDFARERIELLDEYRNELYRKEMTMRWQ